MEYWEVAASTIAGSAIASGLARAFVSKTLRDLESAISKIGDINTQLAKIAVRLENLDKSHDYMRDIDRKVVALETKINGSKR